MTDSPRFLAPSQAQSVVPDLNSTASQPVAPTTAPSWSETIGANWTLARQDQVGARTNAEDAELKPVVDRLQQLPDDRPWWERMATDRFTNPIGYRGASARTFETSYNRDAVWTAMGEHPELFKELPYHDEASFQAYVHGQRANARAAAQDVISRETGAEHVLGFATGIGAGFTDPININGMVLGGGIGGATRTLLGGIAREALINGALTAVQEPAAISSRAEFGEQTSWGNIATDIGEGAAGGALFHVGGAAIGALGRRLGLLGDAEVAAHFTDKVSPDARTPDQQAALNVIGRQADIDATNPFVPTPIGMDAHAAAMTTAIKQLAELDVPKPSDPVPAANVTSTQPMPIVGAVAEPIAGPAALDAFKARVARVESGGSNTARASTSNAVGLYQFVPDTWVSLYQRRFGAGLSRADILAKRADAAIQNQLMNDASANYTRDLASIGQPATAANLYLEHFLGPKAKDVLRAEPDTPIASILPEKWIAANERVLRGKNAGDVLAWTSRRMGEAPGLREAPTLRPELFGDDVELASAQAALDRANADADALASVPATADEPRDLIDPGADPIPTGDAEQVRTTRGRTVDTQFEVREARDLIDSSSPQFDQSLQPRDRANRAASDVQVAAMAGDLDPAQLASSRLAGQGAPIIGSDSMVESGNGRVAAIRRAYAEHPERADAYRAMVEARHPDAATMDQPVLVRRRTSDLSPEARRAWVAEANERDTMGMSPAEQARADARALSPETMASYQGGELTDARNRGFVRGFLDQVVPASEHNTVVTDSGEINGKGLARINDAILARAYEQPDLIDKLTEAADINIKSIGDVLRRVAPAITQLKDLIAAGRVDRQFDLSEPLAEVAQRVSAARDVGTTINDVIAQTDMFGGAPSPETVALLRLFFRADENGRLTRPRSADTIASAISDYITVARQGADFFGHLPTAEELIYGKRADVAGPDEAKFAATGRAGDRAANDGDAAGRSGGSGGAAGDRGRLDAGADLAQDLADARGEGAPPPLEPRGGVDDPTGPEAARIADSLDHDARADLDRGAATDPAIAERQRQQAELGAASPMRAKADQESTIGMGLFDAVDQPAFRLDDEGEQRTLADIMGEIDTDTAALDAAKGCQ